MAGFLACPQPLALDFGVIGCPGGQSRSEPLQVSCEGPIAWSGGGRARGCLVSAVVHLQVHWDKEEVRIFEVGVASELPS